jgi:hypothetical protein
MILTSLRGPNLMGITPHHTTPHHSTGREHSATRRWTEQVVQTFGKGSYKQSNTNVHAQVEKQTRATNWLT